MSDRGVSSVQFVLAGALAMLLFLLMANLVVIQYGRGAIRSALDQGVRVASVTGTETDCEHRIAEVMGQLLGGSMGNEVILTCVIEGDQITASAIGSFRSWTQLMPDFQFELNALATMEPN